MRMYVIVAILVLLLLLLVLTFCLLRLRGAARSARKHDEVAARLAAVVAQAEEERRARAAEIDASDALTLVLPAIRTDDGKPRRVA